eukprot:Hpha_TRINITY_DN7268_c0_g1::TRINITY_DN7268_c0_g1_i1::g.102219::m.102219
MWCVTIVIVAAVSLKWVQPSSDEPPQLVLPRRVTREEARQCLRGKHLVLVGDSHTRMQFMELVGWIRGLNTSGERRPRILPQANRNHWRHMVSWAIKNGRSKIVVLDGRTSSVPSEQRSISSPQEWKDWDDYNSNLTALFGGSLCAATATAHRKPVPWSLVYGGHL